MGRLLALLLPWLLLLPLVLAEPAVAPEPAAAQESRSFVWEALDVAIDLLPDGTFAVAETHRIRFNGSYQRAFREIDLQRLGSITEVQVGEPGQPYRDGLNQAGTFSVSRGDGKLRIQWWFTPTSGTRAFEVRYRVSGAIRVYPGGDQLWWIAVPGDLPAAVQSSTVSVRLPQPVASSDLKAETYVDGRPAPSNPSFAPSEVSFPPQPLGEQRQYEVRVQFPPGLVAATAPPWQADYDRQAWYDSAVKPLLNLFALLATLAVLVGGGLLLFLRWYTAGRDPAGLPAVGEVASPPSKLPPGLVGTVVDERADLQDVLATLLDLANRGVIRITEERDPSLVGSSLDYRVEQLQEQPLGLHPYEKTVLGALFGGQKEIRLSEVKPRWSASIPLFEAQLADEAAQQGLFPENPDRVRARWRKGALTALVIAVIGLFVGPAILKAELAPLPFVGLIVVAVAALKVGPHMPRRTRAGLVEALRWRAFGRHLSDVRTRSPEELTRYLPYAVALGVDRSWLENFAAVGRPASQLVGSNGGPAIIVGPGGWGFPGSYSGGFGGPWVGGPTHGDIGRGDGGGSVASDGGGGSGNPLDNASGGAAGGLNSASGALADLLNAASEALSSGGGGGWSGGGGDFGGGGGSGGGSAGFG